MKNREQWATPFTLLSPLPKRNTKKPWRGVGCQRSAPVFVWSLLPGHSPGCPPVPAPQGVRLPRDSHLEALGRTLLQKQKPYSTPGLGSPDQCSLFDLMRGPQTFLGTCWRPAALRKGAPEAQTQGTTLPTSAQGRRSTVGTRALVLLSAPETSVPRSVAQPRSSRLSGCQGSPDQLVRPWTGVDTPWPSLGPQFASQATDHGQSLFYTCRKVFLRELSHHL